MATIRSLSSYLAEALVRRRVQDLYRERQILLSAQGAEVRIGPETLLSFCSNDYLGLANHPQVIAAFKQGAERYGVGAGGSHLISGHSLAHHALEEELADFVGAPRALLFSAGYMANLGVAGALVGRRGNVFEDKLNHASLIDAARLCQARVKRYGHCAVDKLESMLSAASGEKLILTDGVFSMDGDFARLPDLVALATQHEAWLLVDDAHGLGVVGDGGRGSFEHFHLALNEPAILMGTLGKAFGTFGAFVAGSEIVIESLIQEARTYIYTTALPPAVAEATRASLKLARDEAWRRERLHEHVRFFRREAQTLGLKLLPSDTPIQPLILGEPGRALAAGRYLRAQGILVSAIRPPTVPAHSARLRITFSAAHESAQVERLLEALAGLPGMQ